MNVIANVPRWIWLNHSPSVAVLLDQMKMYERNGNTSKICVGYSVELKPSSGDDSKGWSLSVRLDPKAWYLAYTNLNANKSKEDACKAAEQYINNVTANPEPFRRADPNCIKIRDYCTTPNCGKKTKFCSDGAKCTYGQKCHSVHSNVAIQDEAKRLKALNKANNIHTDPHPIFNCEHEDKRLSSASRGCLFVEDELVIEALTPKRRIPMEYRNLAGEKYKVSETRNAVSSNVICQARRQANPEILLVSLKHQSNTTWVTNPTFW